MASPSSSHRRDCRVKEWNSASVDRTRTGGSRHEKILSRKEWVLGPKVRVAGSARPSTAATRVRASGITVPEDVVPLVVHHLGRIQPGLLMRLERDIGPGVMGMGGEMEAVRAWPRGIGRSEA